MSSGDEVRRVKRIEITTTCTAVVTEKWLAEVADDFDVEDRRAHIAAMELVDRGADAVVLVESEQHGWRDYVVAGVEVF